MFWGLIRLIQNAGAKGPDDCVEFLRYKHKRLVKRKTSKEVDIQPRLTLVELKEQVEEELNSNEFVEDEEGFR
jgi:hypothetical protein